MSTESADLYTVMQAAHATDRNARFGDPAPLGLSGGPRSATSMDPNPTRK